MLTPPWQSGAHMACTLWANRVSALDQYGHDAVTA